MFRTEVLPEKSQENLDYQKPMMMLGSCFTENMGEKLEQIKYPVDVNPFGIIYNPMSVAHSLRLLLSRKQFCEDDLFFQNELYNSYSHHSRFSDLSVEKTLEGINTRLDYSRSFLQKAKYLVLTFGTAWVYELSNDGSLVSNCHKVPAHNFTRRLVSIEEIVKTYSDLLDEIKQINPEIQIILTISPVRHLKDGAHGNQISKSTLMLAVHQLEQLNHAHYFPSYEIILDDLRDYRFYDEDLTHPNHLAVEYIWEKFQHCFFTKEMKELSLKVYQLVKASQHRPFNQETKQHQKFLSAHLRKTKELKKENPELDLDDLVEYFSKE